MSDRAASDGPVFHMQPMGMLANRMIQYMVALNFASQVPGCRISNFSLPEWGIEHPPIDSAGPVISIGLWRDLGLPRLVRAVREGGARRIQWSGYGQKLENLLPRERYLDTFVARSPMPDGFGKEYLLCPVRAGDILNGDFGDYPLTPVEFYQEVVDMTGLRPVFMGQTEPNAYMDRLRDQFPDAPVLPSMGPIADFEMIRRSKNIVVGVSTFIWLAAWLSEADNIFMAANGLFNPMQHRLVMLLPFGDPRYRFWLFPFNGGVKLGRHEAVHRRLAPCWRLLPHSVLHQMVESAPREPRRLETMLSVFDERYYRAANPDVAAAVQAGILVSGTEHYIRAGFAEHRSPLAFSPFWYAERYLVAALEVGQGDYADMQHHYAAVGRFRGCRPLPG